MLTEPEKILAKQYITENVDLMSNLSLGEAVAALLDFMVTNAETIASPALIQAYFDQKAADKMATRKADIEAQIASLPSLEAKLQAELDELNK